MIKQSKDRDEELPGGGIQASSGGCGGYGNDENGGCGGKITGGSRLCSHRP